MKILGISGSLRKASYNTQLLRAAGALLGDDATLEVFDLDEIPLYSSDLDGEIKPASVQALLKAIAGADGMLIATPEYNYSVSGVLKNAIDWASRPAYESVMRGKPTGVLSASISTLGGARAQIHLRDILAATLTPVYLAPDFALASAHTAFDETGHLVDGPTRDYLQQYLSGFTRWGISQQTRHRG